MKPFLAATLAVAMLNLYTPVHAAVVAWTFAPSVGSGIRTHSNGDAFLLKPNVTPTTPSPAGVTWVACTNNAIWLSKSLAGVATPENILNRILSNVMLAQASTSNMRISIDRDASNNCYAVDIEQTTK